MLQISQAAALHLRSLVPDDAPERTGLRIFVQKGGCAGLQYEMRVDQASEGDLLSERDGALVMVDAHSHAFLKGAELDYCDDLTGTGFRIVNPNAARSCGCGTSFEPAKDSDGSGSVDGVAAAAGASLVRG
jgi:iron-sulfur cluster assembly accessory protein